MGHALSRIAVTIVVVVLLVGFVVEALLLRPLLGLSEGGQLSGVPACETRAAGFGEFGALAAHVLRPATSGLDAGLDRQLDVARRLGHDASPRLMASQHARLSLPSSCTYRSRDRT